MSGKPGRSGRRSLYTPQLADEICERLAKGESLNAISNDPRMPPRTTVIEWVENNREGFADRYTRARQRGYELMAEELVDISDDASNDWMVRAGLTVPDYEVVQRSRLRVETRKWLLSKMLPKQFGDRVTQELIGDGDRPIVSRIELVPISPRRPAIEGPEDDQ